MAVGDRIKRVRNFRGMTQKELGIAVGFDEKSADIRIAQYESNTRTPKEDLLRKIAEVLDVNYRSLYEPTLYAAEDIMYTLFELDEHYPGTRIYEVTDTTDPDFPEKHMAVSFRYRLLDEFLQEWQLRKKQLASGEITKEEYRRLKGKIAEQIQQLEANISYLKEEMQVMADGIGTDDPYLTAFLKYKNIQSLNRGIMVELVKAVWVHENGEITVDFNFADEYQRIIDYIENNHNVIRVIENKAI